MTHRMMALMSSVAAIALAAGCKSSAEKTADSAAAAQAAAPPPADTAAMTPPALTDANIVYVLDQANMADSARGALAAKNGTSADVKSFGRLMAGEHHALRAEGQALAKRLSVTPEAPAGDQSEAQAKTEMDSLTATSKGSAWDKAYINFEVGYHKAVLETATKALTAAQNQDLKNLIQKAAPILQHHLDRAQQIQTKQGS